MTNLKLGYLTGEFPRATDTWIHREIAGLRDNGVTVETFAVRRPGPEHMIGPEQRDSQATTTYLLELIRSTRLVTDQLRCLLASPRRLSRAWRLARQTKRPGFRGGLYQLFYLAEAAGLAVELKRRNIDHLHNHLGDSSCTVAMLASELSGVPFSFTLHGSGIFFEAHTWRLDEKIRRSAFCACISHFTRAQAAIFAPDHTDKLHIVHCGVEPHRLHPIEHRGPGTRLLFVGRIDTVKGLDVLLTAVASLHEHHPDLGLTIVGDGPRRSALEDSCRRRGLADVVDFVGSKSQDDVARLVSEHDIFVLSSFAEGVPVVLMEAMGAGLGVVATQVGGVTELVDDEVSGLLVRPFDSVQLAESIDRLIDDPDLRARLGKAGRATVLADFVSSEEATRLATLIANYHDGVTSAVRPSLPEAQVSDPIPAD